MLYQKALFLRRRSPKVTKLRDTHPKVYTKLVQLEKPLLQEQSSEEQEIRVHQLCFSSALIPGCTYPVQRTLDHNNPPCSSQGSLENRANRRYTSI